MILSISYDNYWTTEGPIKHKIAPYFLLQDKPDIPVLEGVTSVSEPYELDSWVNWGTKVKVRKLNIIHPSKTPEISTNYYKLGFETYQQSIPFHTVVSTESEANGLWPLDTNNNLIEINCMVVDIEYLKNIDYLSCIGLGEFKIKIKSSVDLINEDFKLELTIPDDIKITQLLCDKNESPVKILKQYVKHLNNTHILIGHNIDEFDNYEMFQIFSKYDQFKSFIRSRFYNHQAFFRGRVSNNFTTFYPITFDTLLSSRFLYKGESEVGYGLKQLAIKFNLNLTNRVYERDFGSWDNWNIHNPQCLTYNQHDVLETFQLFKKEAKAILLQMLITGMSFDDVVQDSNGRIADCLSLIRGKHIIHPPMMNPLKVAQALQQHFKGELHTKEYIFNYFREHECTSECAFDNKDAKYMRDKLLRVVKYGQEAPDYITYYPLLLDYVAIGGFTEHPGIAMTPLHNINKADVSAMYPTIVKSLNICPDTIKLSLKGETVNGWCWFKYIGNKDILNLFEYRPKDNGFEIGYQQRHQEGLLNKALTGVLKVVQTYKALGKTDSDWKLAYDKSLKPMRNAFSFGVLLGVDATCQQFNIAGAAITTMGQEITTNFNQYLEQNGYKLIYSDTDGSEFININSKNSFEHYIRKIEQWWKPKLNNYPLQLDIEEAEHKIYFKMKNYVSIDHNNITLKGHNLHGHDKPKVWEKTFKRLMLEIVPNTNTTEELIAQVRNLSQIVVKEEMQKATLNDLIIIQSVANPETYKNEQYTLRARIIERLLKRKITFGGKIEFLVTKHMLPDWIGRKSKSEPIGWMWPKELAEDIDYEWYENMIYQTIDTIFSFEQASSKLGVRSLYTEFQSQPNPVPSTYTPTSTCVSTSSSSP